jgi:curved DNA-binding protein
VRKYHPDVSKEADAQQKTQEINEAYGVLGDAEKRAAYDDLGRGQQYRAGQEFRPPPDWGRGFGGGARRLRRRRSAGSDFFADLFANLGGGRRRQHRRRGEDSHASITIDLADSYHGATRTVSLMQAERDAQDRIVTRERNLSVNIPKGVTAGQQLRLAGQGQPGAAGPGDLYLEIQFRPNRATASTAATSTRRCRWRRGSWRWAARSR